MKSDAFLPSSVRNSTDPSSGFFPLLWHWLDTRQETTPMMMKMALPTQKGPLLLAYDDMGKER